MKNTIITIIALAALLVIALYGYERIFNKPLITTNNEVPTDQTNLPMLDIKQQYANGSYTFVGTVNLPTPCHSLETDVDQIGERSYQIILTTIEPNADIMCAQVIQPRDFKVTFAAPEDAQVNLLFNGQEYTLNRFDVPTGENIDTYDLFIKG